MGDNNSKAIRVTDRTAIKLVRENAPKQRRSLANCAAAAIIAALSGGNDNKSTGREQGEKGKDLGILTATKQIEAEQKKSGGDDESK